jgi:hypothetical protein
MSPTVGLAYKKPMPSAEILPTLEKTFALFKPATRLPIDVLLPTNAEVVAPVAVVVPVPVLVPVVVPVPVAVPGGVAATGII